MTTTTERGPWVLAAGAVGAALGLVIYRFGVLPISWKSTALFVFPTAAAALVVCARAFVQHRIGRPPIWMLVLGGLVGLAAALGLAYVAVPPPGRAKLTVRELPGFSIALPDGDETAEASTYDVGKISRKNVAGMGGAIFVQWEAGVASREDLELAAKALGPAIGAKEKPILTTTEGPGGTKVDMVVIDSNKTPLWLSSVPCGARQVVIGTMGGSGTETMHRRVVRTVVCHADPKEAALAMGVVPVALDLPGWFATSRDSSQMVLSDGMSMLMLKSTVVNAGGLEALIAPLFNALGWKIAVTGKIQDRVLLTGTVDDLMVHGWARQLACPRNSIVMVAFADDAAAAELIATKVATARCTQPGEAPTVWPDAPAEEPAAPAPTTQ